VAGHILPTVEVGRHLADRGHDVAWLSYRKGVTRLLAPDAELLVVADAVDRAISAAVDRATAKSVGGAAAFVGVWRDYFGPVAREMLPTVERAVQEWRPDVLVVDQQAVAGAVVADRHGLPWATSATTSVEIMGRFAQFDIDPVTMAYLYKALSWFEGYLRDLLVDLGMSRARAEEFDPRFSPALTLGYTTAEFLGRPLTLPDTVALVGPSTGARHLDVAFPWEWLDGRPLVFVSLGTVNWRGGGRFFTAAAEAVADLDVQAVLVCPDDALDDTPPNVITRELVPQLELLDKAAAVVTHAGHNTVVESLARALPMVVSPVRDDQPVIADQVVRAGAGVFVKYGRITADQLREAIGAVLTDATYRQGAERIRASFEAAGGPAVAADRLIALLGDATPGGG
jgi:MGT family glycosyltransferase